MKPGTKVRMTEELKRVFRLNNCAAHVEEFGDCVGIVEGPVDYGTTSGPELDVRWQPSNLRYAYDPKYLRIVE